MLPASVSVLWLGEWADHKETPPEVSVVMPCLNEAETLAICIRKATLALRESRIDGEIIVADNGSTDGSQTIALQEGAPTRPGHGARLWACPDGRYRSRSGQVRDHGGRRRQLRLS